MKCSICNENTNNPKFCSRACSNTANKTKPLGKCKVCKIEIPFGNKFCSNKCQAHLSKQSTIERWKSGKITGLQTTGVVIEAIKTYLREKYGNKCCLCGWNKVNLHTGKVPLVADHIDGNFSNNTEENLRLICWNCDSLGATFGGANKGSGRKFRTR